MLSEDKHTFIIETEGEGKQEFVLDDFEYWHIFAGHNPLTTECEPKYEKKIFKTLSKLIQREVKQHLKKGEMKHVAKVTDAYWDSLFADQPHKPKQKGATYAKDNDNK